MNSLMGEMATAMECWDYASGRVSWRPRGGCDAVRWRALVFGRVRWGRIRGDAVDVVRTRLAEWRSLVELLMIAGTKTHRVVDRRSVSLQQHTLVRAVPLPFARSLFADGRLLTPRRQQREINAVAPTGRQNLEYCN